MADSTTGMMITMAIDDLNVADRRMVEQVLLRVEGVSAYRLTDDGLLTVALDHDDDEPLLKTLFVAGILPRIEQNMETHRRNLGGLRAC